MRLAVATALGMMLAGVGLAVPAQAQTVIGTEYEHINFGGSSLNVTAPTGFVCTTTVADVERVLSSMPAGWDNRISSYRTFSNCWARHFEHINFGGANVGFSGTSSYIGDAMNDRTSSIQWS